MTTVLGTLFSDVLVGSAAADTVYGGGEAVTPLDLADTVMAGNGADVVYGNGGNDLLLGELGVDTLYGGVGNDSLYGGRNTTDTADSADALYGLGGRDWLFGNAGNDTLVAGDDADTLYGGLGNDVIYGGNTFASSGDGADWIAAGAGSDTVYGNEGDDSIFGGSGVVDASDAADVIDGGAGNDILYGNGGDDSLVGGAGNDTLYGGAGADTLEGGEGVDVIVGDSSDDIRGGSGIDRFVLDVAQIQSSNNIHAITEAEADLLTIHDLEAGEVLKIINTGGGSVAFTEDANGNAILTIDGQQFATLEGVGTSAFTNGSDTGNSVSYTVGGGSTSGSGGGGGGGNAAPTLADLTAVTFLENTVNASAQVIDTAVTFADTDSANLDTGNVTVTYSAGGAAQDSLSIRHQGNGAGQIGFDGTTVRYEGTSIGTITTNGTSGANLVVTLNASATPTAVDALIQNLTYSNSSNTPTATRDISITVSDGDGGTSTAATATITVTAEAEAAAASATLAFSALNGTTGFRLDGVAASDYAGRSVASAGDINGDGFEDLFVGAPYASPNGASSGSSYVVFGAAGGFAASINLSSLNGTTGFRLDGVAANDYSGNSVFSAGDINGDSFDDLIIGAPYASPNGASSGSSYVVFGSNGGFAATLNLSSLNGTTGVRLDGVAADDRSGRNVSSAGDVNGDGYSDVIVGAFRADPNGASSGSAYVVFGASGGFAASANLSALNGTTGFRLDGAAASDYAGRSVASAGDVNGDGLDDIIVGADGSDSGVADAGSSYVVFGKVSGFAASVSLSGLNGTTGFRLDGVSIADFSSRSASSAGDVNGDGFDDVIVGAYGAYPNGNDSGASYVVFGAAGGFASSIALSSLNGTTGFRLNGVAAGDFSGRFVASAGDFNGDGFDDLIVGAPYADPNGNFSGSSYVVFGAASGFAAAVNLSSLNGTTGFRVDGLAASDFSGHSVSSAGDINGDGFDDVIVGAYGADPNGSKSGSSYTIFGNNNSGAADAVGTSGADIINGTVNDDVFVGGLGNDVLTGFAGADVLKGANGDDNLLGHAGADKLFGGQGADTLDGGDDADMLYGDKGADSLTGGAGADKLWGDDGNDTLIGGTGADSLVGGLGSDVFFFAAGDSTITNLDVVTLNFDQDTLDIASAAADTVNTVAAVTANALADVVAAYDNTGINQIGDANLIQVTAGTLAGKNYVILSTDGNATYDEGVDLLFQVIGGGTFTVADIV